MAQVNKIDSNSTALAWAVEQSLKTLPGTPVWNPLEPNGYTDFGGEITTVSRDPINDSRQRKKGVVTDLDASGGFGTDLTQANIQELLQGFMFADFRRKDELAVATVDGTNDDFEPASGGDGYVANDLLFAKGFDDDANNGLHVVTGSPGAATVPVTTDLVAATSQSGTISRVGVELGSGDTSIDASGTWPKLVNSTKDLTTLGLNVGEFIYIGGDDTSDQFATAANNGFARIRSISANEIEFDKTQGTMVTDAGTGKTIRLFFGRVLKNESVAASQVRRTYQLERKLGAPDDASPAQIQSEYITGAIPNELAINIPTADKVLADLSFVGLDHETRTGATGIKSGTRATLTEEDAFNTSSDFSRMKLAQVVSGSPDESALFAYVTELSITINNNVTPNKAVAQLGAFDASAGTFEVSGSITAYFSNVTAINAVRNNVDVTLDALIVKNNKGIVIDLPLVSLGNGRLNIEKDQPVTLPLSMNAATGAKNNANADHTLLMCFFDYLPNAADL